MFIGILIIGESHIFYLDNFSSQYSYTTLYLQDTTTSVEMISDITNSATSNNVEVFTIVTSHPNSSLTEYNIYGTPGVESHVNKDSNIFEKKYTSLLLGDINFKFNSINDIPNIKSQNEYRVIGSKENIHKFKMDLIDKYAGNHPKPGYLDKESKNNTIAIWGLITSIVLLFSVYDVISQKKENLIRVTMGEKISNIICKNILIDSFALIVSFTLIFFILSKYTYVFFNFKISIIIFGILLSINGLLYLSLYFSKVKEVFSNGESSKKLLSLNYGLKLVTTIITIFIISSNIVLIYNSYTFYKQKAFFQDHSDYYYLELMYKTTMNSDGSLNSRWEDSALVQETFYKEFFKEFNAISVKDLSLNQQLPTVFANRNAFEYLSSKIDELSNLNLDKDFYFILPDKLENNPEIIETLKNNTTYTSNEINFLYDYDVIYYQDNIDMVGIDEDYIYGSYLLENPAIVYNNMSVDQVKNLDITKQVGLQDELSDVMYQISSETQLEKFNDFIADHNLEGQIIKKTNVLEKYENMWIIAKRVLYINLIFSDLVLLLEIIIINSIVMLEYKVNAIELSIKKILGYSILQKNRKIILMTVITTIASILTAIIVNIIMKTHVGKYLGLGGLIILILELSTIIFYINRIEKSNIQKILKGGSL